MKGHALTTQPPNRQTKANTERGKNGIIHAMQPHAKTALSLALAIVGGIAAGMRCDASEWVENSSQINPRVAAYTVKAYTEGTDPFDATILQCMKECTNADCIECNGR